MRSALRIISGEWIKVRTSRGTRLVCLAAVVASGIIAALTVDQLGQYGYTNGPVTGYALVSLGGASGLSLIPAWILLLNSLNTWGEEYGGNFVHMTMIYGPNRFITVTSKAAINVLVNCLTILVCSGVAVMIGLASGIGLGDSATISEVLQQTARNVYFVGCASLMCSSVAAIVGSATLAACVTYLYPLLIEPAIKYVLQTSSLSMELVAYISHLPYYNLAQVQASQLPFSGFRETSIAPSTQGAMLAESAGLSIVLWLIACYAVSRRNL